MVTSPDEAYAAIRRFLSYLPSYAGGPLPVADDDAEPGYDDQIARLVPARRSRAYDMKAVIRRLGFMDPPVAANVLFEPQIRELPEAERAAFLAAKAAELGVGFEPYGVATNLTVDEIIEPGATRSVVAGYLRTVLAAGPRPGVPGPLATWPRWS